MGELRLKQRLLDVRRFYGLLDEIESQKGSKRLLAECTGKMNWPRRGVYFFFEPGEFRPTSGGGLRVVRIGTHALKVGSKSTLWKRLRQHHGTNTGRYAGGGNHRGSIFRSHVGCALIEKESWPNEITSEWSQGGTASSDLRSTELPLERRVSEHIRAMPFQWLEIGDEPGPDSLRGYIERNSIALLSNYPHVSTPSEGSSCIDPPSVEWLGRSSHHPIPKKSGLWNVNHVDEEYDQDFLDKLNELINGRKG